MTELSGLLAVERFDRAATLTFGRPPLNILDLDLLAELDAALARLAEDRELQVVFVRRRRPPASHSLMVKCGDIRSAAMCSAHSLSGGIVRCESIGAK